MIMNKNRMYQNVMLELSTGKLIHVTVPAFCQVGDRITVKEIRVTNPKELPTGCSFEELVPEEL
jgi:hypothetical protein